MTEPYTHETEDGSIFVIIFDEEKEHYILTKNQFVLVESSLLSDVIDVFVEEGGDESLDSDISEHFA